MHEASTRMVGGNDLKRALCRLLRRPAHLVAGLGAATVAACALDTPALPHGLLDATFTIDGKAMRLSNGVFDAPAAPGSATRIRLSALGMPVSGDLDNDGRKDAALFLLHEPGGSGAFLYVTAALGTSDRFVVTNALLLGDRVEPRGIAISQGTLAIEYTARAPGAPFATTPTVNVMRELRLVNGVLVGSSVRASAPW
ncbi:MAG: hypothetical protein RLW61_17080 [Gammaproteobacteria bacterium]